MERGMDDGDIFFFSLLWGFRMNLGRVELGIASLKKHDSR